MEKNLGVIINGDKTHNINDESMELLENIYTNEKLSLKNMLDQLMYSSSENVYNQQRIINLKKAILIKQKTDNIVNNLFFTTKFDDFKEMEFDFFKNEYDSLEKVNKMLGVPHELVVSSLYQYIVYHKDAGKFLEYLKSKGVDYSYKIIDEVSMHNQYKLKSVFRENSLLLNIISENQIKFYEKSNANLVNSIKYLLKNNEIIDEPGCLTLNSNEKLFKVNNYNSNIISFLHIKDVRDLIEKYNIESKKNNMDLIFYIETNDVFKKEFSNVIIKNKEKAVKENLETIFFKMFIEKNQVNGNYRPLNEKSIKERIQYFKDCLRILKDVNISISDKQKQILVNLIIKDSSIENLVLPEGWFKEFGGQESFKAYLNKDFLSYKKDKDEINFFRPDLYEENKENFIKMVEKDPKIMEIPILNTFSSLMRSESVKQKSSQDLNLIIKKIFTDNELYSIYTNTYNNSFREPFLNKLKSMLKKEKNIKNSESFYLNLSMFLNNPDFTLNSKQSIKKRI